MDIEQAYEAMINDIFWDGKAVGVCLSLPIITEINDVLSDMSEDERNAMKLHYGLTGEKPLSSLLVAGVLGTKKPKAEEILVRARKHFIERLIYERNFDVELFMMSRQELLNAAYEAKLQLRRANLKIDDLKKELAREKQLNAKIKHDEEMQKAGAPYNIALADIGLKSHTLDCLRRHGWKYIFDVADKTERDFAFVYRFGEASLADLRACLEPYGIKISR